MVRRAEVLLHAANLERYRRLRWMDLTDVERERVERLYRQEWARMENLRRALFRKTGILRTQHLRLVK
jgi:hypothetical protein